MCSIPIGYPYYTVHTFLIHFSCWVLSWSGNWSWDIWNLLQYFRENLPSQRQRGCIVITHVWFCQYLINCKCSHWGPTPICALIMFRGWKLNRIFNPFKLFNYCTLVYKSQKPDSYENYSICSEVYVAVHAWTKCNVSNRNVSNHYIGSHSKNSVSLTF